MKKHDKTNFKADRTNIKLYEDVKQVVLNYSQKYCEEMTRSVVNNITREPHFIKKGLNDRLGKLVNEILNEII